MITTFGAWSEPIVKPDISPFRVLLAGLAWRFLGTRGSGETLIEAMAGDDEQNTMLAGMSLVKAGKRSVDLIARNVDSGDATPSIIRLLPDLDSPDSRALLDRISATHTGEIADVAGQCAAQLERMDQVRSERS